MWEQSVLDRPACQAVPGQGLPRALGDELLRQEDARHLCGTASLEGAELARLGTAGQLPILEKHLRAWLERPSEGVLVVVVGERGIDITSHSSGGRPTTWGERCND